MAPRKRKTGVEKKSADAGTTVGRVTRSGTSRSKLDALPQQNVRKTKKAKTSNDKNTKPEEKTVDSENGNGGDLERAEEEKETKDADAAVAKRTIIIEHCKQCTSFKKRADMVKTGLEEGVPGINVILNPEKPRRGCFEVREDGGETFISLLDMKRPFKRMKDLDMDKVTSEIIEKVE